MISNIFEINCININIIDWDNKKKNLLKLLDNYPEESKEFFHTNKHLPRSGLLPEFCEMFDPEIIQMQKETKMRVHIKDVWTVTYKKNEFHNPHNHGHLGFNGDCKAPCYMTKEVVDELEKQIKKGFSDYVATDGFFWGQQFQEEQAEAYKDQDIKFLKFCQQAINDNRVVEYWCSW